MKSIIKNYIRAVAIMVGMIIGVGLFGIPYVLAKAGAIFGISYFIFLGAVIVCVHLIYAETMLRTDHNHRLAGLAGIYLGRPWRWITLAINTVGFYSVIVAYIIMGGEFLRILLSPIFGGALITYQLIFFTVMAVMIFFGLRIVASGEIILTFVLLAALVAIISTIFLKVNPANFSSGDISNFFLPYGVILFAIGGTSAVPEVLEVMGKNKKKAKSVIFWATLAAVALIAIFSFAILGVTGVGTTKDAISGLAQHFGSRFIYLTALFGLFAIASSFLPFGLYFRDQFTYDFKINKFLSWILACIVPFIIFLFGTRDFIKIISFGGAVLAGLEGIILICAYLRARRYGRREPEFTIRLPVAIFRLIMVIFLLGVVYEAWSFFR